MKIKFENNLTVPILSVSPGECFLLQQGDDDVYMRVFGPKLGGSCEVGCVNLCSGEIKMSSPKLHVLPVSATLTAGFIPQKGDS